MIPGSDHEMHYSVSNIFPDFGKSTREIPRKLRCKDITLLHFQSWLFKSYNFSLYAWNWSVLSLFDHWTPYREHKASSMRWVYKTSVTHFKVKNTPLKQTDGKGKFKRILTFLLVENGTLFFTKSSFEKFEIHEIFITAEGSAWPVLKRNQAAKFFKNFQAHFVL